MNPASPNKTGNKTYAAAASPPQTPKQSRSKTLVKATETPPPTPADPFPPLPKANRSASPLGMFIYV